MLVDNVTLVVKAGDGGNGAATFARTSMKARGGPETGVTVPSTMGLVKMPIISWCTYHSGRVLPMLLRVR